MWGAVIGGLVGAGAGYAVSSYSSDVSGACYGATYQPNILDITQEQKMARIEQAGSACNSQHPIASFLGQHTDVAMGGALVLGSAIGYFAGRR
jgi:hypothetical protein